MYAQLACLACGALHPAKEFYRCPTCGGELDLRYDLERIRAERVFASTWTSAAPAWRRFAALLPLAGDETIVTLGEGNTPLVHARRLGERLGLRDLHFKLEGSNPTGSFKDRQVSIAISKAREWDRRRFATVSSGNVGVALSAYAARAGAEALVWVSGETSASKRRQIEIYGARLFLLPPPTPDDAGAYFAAVVGLSALCASQNIVPMISARPVNPYIVEGAKTIAYEIAADLGRAPDLVFAPVGGGGLLGGLAKGFADLAALGLTKDATALHGAQRRAYFVPLDDWDDPKYRSSAYYRPLDGEWAWSAICQSGGRLAHVSDEEILAAEAILAEEEGIFAEPHGAYAAAALMRAAAAGEIDAGASIVCIISGFGLKDMEAAAEIVERRARRPRAVESLEASIAFLDGEA